MNLRTMKKTIWSELFLSFNKADYRTNVGPITLQSIKDLCQRECYEYRSPSRATVSRFNQAWHEVVMEMGRKYV